MSLASSIRSEATPSASDRTSPPVCRVRNRWTGKVCGIELVPALWLPGYFRHAKPAGHYPKPFRLSEVSPVLSSTTGQSMLACPPAPGMTDRHSAVLLEAEAASA